MINLLPIQDNVMAVDDGVVDPPEDETSLGATVMDLVRMIGTINYF